MDLTNSAAQSPDARPTSTLTLASSPASVQLSVSPGPALSSGPSTTNKMYSLNANGTAILTTTPCNEAELQLYRVMQRASLLAYYDTLLEMGGDDVQQLCDAGEEEFLEIMALVGMASKPLHVRRFQKSLQEWMIDPSAFQVPLTPSQPIVECSSSTRHSILDTNRPTSSGSKSSSRSNSPLLSNECSVTIVLNDTQVARLRSAAEQLSTRLPTIQPRTLPAKRKVARDLDAVLAMPDSEPRRMEAIRRYAAIYGRFDCKRRPEKPLTLHEVCVNEAAAQLCHFVPALLTRRDELFPLARQLVRDSAVSFTLTANNGKQWNRRKSNDDDIEVEEEPPTKKAAITDKTNA